MRVLVAAAITALAAAGCASSTSSAGPPSDTSVCGTNLGQNWGGGITDLAADHPPQVADSGANGEVFLRVSDSCQHGAQVTWSRHIDSEILKVARASDGLPVVVVLSSPDDAQDSFTVTASMGGRTVGKVIVR
jgi:hypothetical protein